MKYKYDVAISYQSEIEERAAKIAGYLEREGLQVFYAPEKQKQIMSEKLNEILYDIYKNQSLIRLLLISDAYLSSEWTQLEMRVSKGEEKVDLRRRIIVDYTDKKQLPEDVKSMIYIDGRKTYEDDIASMTAFRIKELKSKIDDDWQKYEKKKNDEKITVINNTGIVTGDNASFGNINFGR